MQVSRKLQQDLGQIDLRQRGFKLPVGFTLPRCGVLSPEDYAFGALGLSMTSAFLHGRPPVILGWCSATVTPIYHEIAITYQRIIISSTRALMSKLSFLRQANSAKSNLPSLGSTVVSPWTCSTAGSRCVLVASHLQSHVNYSYRVVRRYRWGSFVLFSIYVLLLRSNANRRRAILQGP